LEVHQFLKKPVSGGAIDRNLQRSDVLISSLNSDSISISKTQLSGAISAETETVLYSNSFRTSMFSTFSDKLNSITIWNTQYAIDVTLMSLIGIQTTLSETFDKYETEGFGSGGESLVTVEALRGTPWLDTHVYPQVYEMYGSDGITLNRNTDILGVLPLRAMIILNGGEKDYLLNNLQNTSKTGDVFIRYYVPHYVYSDFSELRNKAAAMYMGNPGMPVQAQRLLSGSINDLTRGDYPFKINYRIPGKNTITTSREFNITY
jgi:hypothetical protein